MSVYQPLSRYLKAREQDSWRTSFAEVERVLDRPLPRSAFEHRPWWANQRAGRRSQAQAWLDAGWEMTSVDLVRKTVTFTRVGAPAAENAEPASLLQRLVRKTATLGRLIAPSELPEDTTMPFTPQQAEAEPVTADETSLAAVPLEAPETSDLPHLSAEPATAEDRDSLGRKALMTMIQREALLVKAHMGNWGV
ncbi:hypothetical protein [Novosphingobium sp. FKTRR1]|uniref:DUF7662 domain-containing protein n=1 Tax=Novosphingobium sp. FKTRR1 TaxID=2879118 RepID=UPI001CEFE231|nr:hypothetical protein [Novosphingobium sp. FKTRR1]